MKTPINSLFVGSLLAMLGGAGADARGFKILHSFSGADGADPFGGLALSSNGEIFAATRSGGASNLGTLFALSGSTLTTLGSFTTTNGYGPEGSLVTDSNGICKVSLPQPAPTKPASYFAGIAKLG